VRGEEGEQVNCFVRLHYNPETGLFTWACAGKGIRAGAIAGHLDAEGYWVVKVGYRPYRAHRLAWFLTHGEWPAGEVDHINHERADNRIFNLRVVDRAGNMQNQQRPHVDNKSCGLLGVTWNKQHKRWQAKIVARKVRHHVGYFSDPQVAHEAYMAAKRRLHIGGEH